jgi:FKBP-type peptidyl-prolyl cis-trans isomerase
MVRKITPNFSIEIIGIILFKLPGLAISIPKMSLGTKVKVICPPELAYGARGLPPKVPPNTTLVLEIELLSVETADEEPDE